MTRPPVARQRLSFWIPIGVICLAPAALSLWVDGMAWSPGDHASFALLILCSAGLWRLVNPALETRRQRYTGALAVVGTGVLIWANLAVGVIGDESNAINRIFWAVPALLLVIFAAMRWKRSWKLRHRTDIQSRDTRSES